MNNIDLCSDKIIENKKEEIHLLAEKGRWCFTGMELTWYYRS